MLNSFARASRRPTARGCSRLETLESRTLFATLPAGFALSDYVTGLPECTSMAFAPDGRIFYTEKSGAVRVIKNGVKLATPVVRVSVDGYFERGLECIALDPNFATNGVFYLYYTKRPATNAGTAPNDAKNRVSRFQMNLTGNTDVVNPNVAEAVVVGNIPSDSGYHNGGSMVFGADGYMYVGVGEVGLPSFDQATDRAQDLSTLAGKILRINPRAGAQLIPSDNPYVGQTGKRGEIYSSGVRNPFTMAVKPGTNTVYANDVGSWMAEEVNRVAKGANFGFPRNEGYTNTAGFTNPVYAYTHASTGHPNGQAAITGGTFITGNKFPAQYQGRYFFSDYINQFIAYFDPANPPARGAQAPKFATGAGRIIDLDMGPDGNLYGLTHTVGATSNSAKIVKFAFTGSANRNPEAVASADKTSGPLPLTVAFSGDGTTDADGDPLTYTWNFGDGSSATGKNVSHTYETKGVYTATLTVTDGRGGSDGADPITVHPGNVAPNVTISLPADGSPYSGGETINFAGSASDPEDGTIAASKFDWKVTLFHDTHTHPFLDDIDGVASGSFKVPVDVETAPNQFYRIQLTVTDSAGVSTTRHVDIQPRTSTFTLASNVSGITLNLDGQPRATPTSILGVVGTRRRLDAPLVQTVNGTDYEFVAWSDGGNSFHDISTPAADTTYTATYRVATTASATLRSTADAYVRDGTSAATNFGTAADLIAKRSANAGNTRESYLRFNVASFANITAATLRVFGRSTTTQNVPVALYGAANTNWTESNLTWNTRPSTGATAIAPARTVAGTTGTWYEFNVSDFVRQQKEAGAATVTFALKATGVTDAQALFVSDENASANKPQLLLRYATPQGLILSRTSATADEGGSAAFTVRLAAQPAADVVVSIARQSGDADLTAEPATVTFTPANWDTPQTVTVSAAEDADALNGSAVFAVSATDMATKTVTVTEVDNDGPTILRALADAYVRDGNTAATNFGTATDLVVKRSANAGNTRETYLRFNLSGVSAVGTARLRLFGRLTLAGSVVVNVHTSSDTTWSETGINWNNKPAADAAVLATATLTSTAGQWLEWDLSSFLQAEKAAGRDVVTLVLKPGGVTDPVAIFNSDEASANRPELAITAPTEVPQALVVSPASASVPEGGTNTFTIRLAKAPASDVVVEVGPEAGGDADLGGAPTTLTFTAADWDAPQTVTLSAAEDGDSLNGSAVFAVSSTGLTTKKVTATEADNDAPAAPVDVRPAADAMVRDGTNAAVNYGAGIDMGVKRSANAGNTRETYLRFDLSGVATVGSATLRLFGRLTAAEALQVNVHSASDTTWSEGGITWDNRPAADAAVLASATLTATTSQWVEWDLTAFLQAEKAAGRDVVTLVLRAAAVTDSVALFASDEAAANPPHLRIS
jgi:glucose/arabinose dehydrogenase